VKVTSLNDSYSWFGNYTGYGQLGKYLSKIKEAEFTEIKPKGSLAEKVRGKIYTLKRGWYWRHDSLFAAAESHFENNQRRIEKDNEKIFHIYYFENHHYLYERFSNKAPYNLLTTIHHPPTQWNEFHRSLSTNIKKISNAFILYQRDIDLFASKSGAAIRFIRHGVNCERFHPGTKKEEEGKEILFVGQNSRNFQMLERVITKLILNYSNLRFTIVLPRSHRTHTVLKKLFNYPQVTWCENLSDQDMVLLMSQPAILTGTLQVKLINKTKRLVT